MRISDWSSDVCSSDLRQLDSDEFREFVEIIDRKCPGRTFYRKQLLSAYHLAFAQNVCNFSVPGAGKTSIVYAAYAYLQSLPAEDPRSIERLLIIGPLSSFKRSEEHTSELQSLMRISYAVFCLNKNTNTTK